MKTDPQLQRLGLADTAFHTTMLNRIKEIYK